MQTQPPPDAPAPPPSEAAELSRLKWKWLIVGEIISVIGCFFWLTRPVVIWSHRTPDLTAAKSNAQQIGLALLEFGTEYGRFPDETTIESVKQKTGTKLYLGKRSSNDFLRQLFASEITSSEVMFYAKGDRIMIGDNVITPGEALKNRECGFTYFLGARPRDNPLRPLVVAPMIPGTDRFDPKPFEGMAVVLSVGNNARSYHIDKKGHVIFEGRNLMDPAHPVWDGHPPAIAWPDL